MAFRGRGRGRGGYGGGSFRRAKEEAYELFPAIKDEDFGNASVVTERRSLAVSYIKLQRYWNSSPYYLADEIDGSKETKIVDIERFSDRKSTRSKAKPPLSHFITIAPAHFPAELVKGGTVKKRAAKRVRWTQELDMQKLDVFAKLEVDSEGQDEKKNEGEDDDEEGEENVEDDGESSDDNGDYEQNRDFDDDEDDFNMDDGNDDEGTYD